MYGLLQGSMITIEWMVVSAGIAQKTFSKEADKTLSLQGNPNHLLVEGTEALKEVAIADRAGKKTDMELGRIEKDRCRVIKDISWVCKSEE